MSTDMIAGLLATFIPLFAVGYLMLNKKPPIFRMFIAMLLVGVGYLTATGAIEDIGARVTGGGEAVAPAATEKAPAPEAPKADAPVDAKPAQ